MTALIELVKDLKVFYQSDQSTNSYSQLLLVVLDCDILMI